MKLRKGLLIRAMALVIAVSFVTYTWAAYEGAREIQTDINADGTVDIIDVVTVALAFGSEVADENWNPVADVNDDDIVDIFDLAIVSSNFGKAVSDVIEFKAVVNGVREVDVVVHVDISDGLTEEEAELIAEATFVQVMGQNVMHLLETLAFDDNQIEAHYDWGYDESDIGHVFDMAADLTTLQMTVSHCF